MRHLNTASTGFSLSLSLLSHQCSHYGPFSYSDLAKPLPFADMYTGLIDHHVTVGIPDWGVRLVVLSQIAGIQAFHRSSCTPTTTRACQMCGTSHHSLCTPSTERKIMGVHVSLTSGCLSALLSCASPELAISVTMWLSYCFALPWLSLLSSSATVPLCLAHTILSPGIPRQFLKSPCLKVPPMDLLAS